MLGLMTASPLVSASLSRNPKPTATPYLQPLEEVCSPHVDMAGMQPVAGDHGRLEDLRILQEHTHVHSKFWREITIKFWETLVWMEDLRLSSDYFWVVMPYSLVEIYPQLGAMYCLHLQDRRYVKWFEEYVPLKRQ